jgi:hypothetical protein
MSEIIGSICGDPNVLAHVAARDMVVGKGGVLDRAFEVAEKGLVNAGDVLDAILCEVDVRGLASAAAAAAAAAKAAELAKTNSVLPCPSSFKLLSSEHLPSSPHPSECWTCCFSPLPPSPSSASTPLPGHALFLLMRTIANVCGCGGTSSGNTMRKAVMEAGAAPFLVASLIPHATARVWGAGGGALKAQPMIGAEAVAGEWGRLVRQEAAGALANLAFATQARAALIRACILDVMEDVGHWVPGDGPLFASSGRSSSSLIPGARLLHETPEFIERCSSVVRSLSQDDACRRRIRGSGRLQELNALAPQQLQDYRFFKARADERDGVFWGRNDDV